MMEQTQERPVTLVPPACAIGYVHPDDRGGILSDLSTLLSYSSGDQLSWASLLGSGKKSSSPARW